jgi:hypothetical protein
MWIKNNHVGFYIDSSENKIRKISGDTDTWGYKEWIWEVITKEQLNRELILNKLEAEK